MKTPEQLKGAIRNIAKKNNLMPQEVLQMFLFEEKQVPVMAYTLETILAEKYETIIRRNLGTTRARDFYDLYVLFQSRKEEVHKDILKMAVTHTATKRGSREELGEYVEI